MADIFEQTMQKLAEFHIESPRLEARILLAHVLNCQTSDIICNATLNSKQQNELKSLIQRRIAHEPLDKIIGKREFYKSTFMTSNNVLSPRPDTEILVEEGLKIIPVDKNINILDLGTGSGCIIESILQERPKAVGVAVDISSAALQTAKQNAANLKLINRLQFVQADWFEEDFAAQFAAEFDIIVTNPPYIPTADIAALAPEVKNHDPLLALDGGADGFASYQRIAEFTPILLKKRGYILLEAGINQAEEIANIFTAQGLKLKNIVRDLAGIKRCVILQK
ncbi:MAG: peptide chain release factor N(5)-glutamine methyltransferase [Alphaproteobacteria bacterium]|nr:peptide chain release factor N(5)-glutamine methyltransferase [Alphaproteobacteria bacterium]